MITLGQLDRAVAKLIAPLKRKVSLMVGRAVLKAVDDSKKVQTVKAALLSDEVSEDVERYQEYGFSSVPFAESEAVVVFVGGNRAHGIVVATDDRARRPKNLTEGDVVLYTDKGVRLKLDTTADEVLLGSSPANFVALANLVLTELQAVQTDQTTLAALLVSHAHAGVLAGGAVSGPSPAFAGYTPHVPAAVAAAEVKAK